jgi:Asp/Glu/hydantoin racemase
MRLLLLNPNTTQTVTDRLAHVAREAASPGTEIVALTAPRGVPYIVSRAEAVIGGGVALEMLAEHHDGFDAAILAAFGDPGLGGARELFPLPVVGLAEAGMLTARMLGRSFSVVSFARGFEPWYRECVAWHGLTSRCASIRCLEDDFASLETVQQEHGAHLVALAARAVEEDGADVVVLAGAPLAGLAAAVRLRIPVPVIDCVAAAVRQAETLVSLQPRKALAGSYRRPVGKASSGLSPALTAWLAHQRSGS